MKTLETLEHFLYIYLIEIFCLDNLQIIPRLLLDFNKNNK